MSTKVYQAISNAIDAYKRCSADPTKQEWAAKHLRKIDLLARECLPSGSGIDTGCSIDIEASTPERIVIRLSYHHMHDAGMYDGWTKHKVTIKPSLQFILDINISGKNRNDVKDFLYDAMRDALESHVAEYVNKRTCEI